MRFAAIVVCAALSSFALPVPTEYTSAMLDQDLSQARLFALVRTERIDTVGTSPNLTERATLRVLACYKGGVAPGESTLVASRSLQTIGWYEPNYRVGERSFVSIGDAGDGIHVTVQTRAKFDINSRDTVEPPPVGLGFSDEFSNELKAEYFANRITQTLVWMEYLSVAPILPRLGQPITLRTTINLSGGGELNSLDVTRTAAQNRVDVTLTHTPCVGICPMIAIVLDTAVSLSGLPAGEHRAYRTEINTLLDAPVPPPDDTVAFTVYAPLAAAPRASAHASLTRTSGPSSLTVDLRGQRIAESTRPGVRVTTNGSLRPRAVASVR